ncbi:MAG: hypothetical protein ABI651_13495 [Verrucomicrobiota bacterium]
MSLPDAYQKHEPTGNPVPHELRFVDPRSEADFDPNRYPTADGTAAPASAPKDRNERITLEFCTVYYQLNRLYARLMETRSHAENPERSVKERAVMQEIENYLRSRDELEDSYAPYGVIAEAMTQEGFTVDIKFTFGNRDVASRRQTRFVSSSALLIFPKPPRSVSNGNKGTHAS